MTDKKKGLFAKAIDKLTNRDEKEELSRAEEKIKELEEKLTQTEDKKKKEDLEKKKSSFLERQQEILWRQKARQKPAVKKHIVKAGDTLIGLAKKYYGEPKMYMILYETNKETIGDDPDIIKVGMELNVPEVR